MQGDQGNLSLLYILKSSMNHTAWLLYEIVFIAIEILLPFMQLGYPLNPSMHTLHFSPVYPFLQVQRPVTLLHTLFALPISSQLQSSEISELRKIFT